MSIVTVIYGKGGASKAAVTGCITLAHAVVVLVYLMFWSSIAEAAQILFFDIKCVNAYIKQGKTEDDFRTKTRQPIECGDYAVLSFLDNHRVLLQTSKKKDKISNVYGFAGAGIDHTEENTWILPVEHMYLPPTGAAADVDSEFGGACIFTGSNSIKKIKHISCSTNIVPNDLFRTLYQFEFDVIRNR